jgi:hypothetical protein
MVNALTDTGAGSGTGGDLRYCITQANLLGGVNTIDATGVTGTISLASTLPTITDPVTITGSGRDLLTVAGSNAFQLFLVNPGAGNAVSISGMTVSGGNSGSTPWHGAAIEQQSGTLTLSGTTLTGNTMVNYNPAGALAVTGNNCTLSLTNDAVTNNVAPGATFANGVLIDGTSDTVTVSNCTISNNPGSGIGTPNAAAGYLHLSLTDCTIANNGGIGVNCTTIHGTIAVTDCTIANNVGAISMTGDQLTITGSTVTGNSAAGGSAAVWVTNALFGGFGINNCTIAGNNCGGVYFQHYGSSDSGNLLTVTSSTIVGNVGFGVGVSSLLSTSSLATVLLDNTIVSGNGTDLVGQSNTVDKAKYSAIGVNGAYAFTDLGHNLAAVSSTPAALGLQPLGDNGGPTQTVAISAYSSAIGLGDPGLNGTADQRGVPRPQQMGPAPQPDIGAVELQLQSGVTAVQINDGSAQRSEVRSLTVTFAHPMTFAGGNDNAAAAFQLKNLSDSITVNLTAAVSANAQGNTVVTLTFSGSETDPVSGTGGIPLSLADGRYQLTILSANVMNPDGSQLVGGSAYGDYVSPTDTYGGSGLHLYRLFGDATGDGVVDLNDLAAFRGTYNTGTGNPAYLSYLDADNSGVVDLDDLTAFRNHYNHSVYS